MMVPKIDAYIPREIARKIEALGVTKARMPKIAAAHLGIAAR